MTTVHVTIAETSTGRYDLLRGGSELVDLSLLAARTAVVLRELSRGGDLADDDAETLRAMAHLLGEAAHAVQFIDSGGREGSPPSGAFAAGVDAAIDAVLDGPMQPTDPAALSRKLSNLSDRLLRAQEPWSPNEANDLGGYFSGLARAVLNQTGHVGEVTATL
jgi:hypothetical protein